MLKCEHVEETSRHDKYFYYPDGTEAGYLCETCAIELGFCQTCGAFVGGVEADLVSMREWGMCYDCQTELEAELEQIDERDQ